VALLLDLDDVPAELSLHRIGDLADLERKGGILERLQHGATGEEAEISAFGVRVLRFLLGDRGEVLALLQPLLNLLGLGLGLDQDVASVDLLLGFHLADLLVIDLLGGVFRHGIGDAGVEERITQRASLVIFDPVRESGGLVEAVLLAGLGHQLVLDDILEEDLPAISGRIAREPTSVAAKSRSDCLISLPLTRATTTSSAAAGSETNPIMAAASSGTDQVFTRISSSSARPCCPGSKSRRAGWVRFPRGRVLDPRRAGCQAPKLRHCVLRKADDPHTRGDLICNLYLQSFH